MTEDPTKSAELSKVAYVTAADMRDFGSGPGESIFLFASRGKWNIALTPHAPAQAQIDALRIENERLKSLEPSSRAGAILGQMKSELDAARAENERLRRGIDEACRVLKGNTALIQAIAQATQPVPGGKEQP